MGKAYDKDRAVAGRLACNIKKNASEMVLSAQAPRFRENGRTVGYTERHRKRRVESLPARALKFLILSAIDTGTFC